MKVKVFPMAEVIVDLPADVASNLIRLGQAEAADEASETAVRAMKPAKKQKKRKDRKGAPENKSRS